MPGPAPKATGARLFVRDEAKPFVLFAAVVANRLVDGRLARR
ncbi:MAG: hypothetical protein ACP5VR_09135 [Acidimicrobiales bacterium]